jgi:ribosomal protein S18 acetylase RimI-like enzyme
MQSVIASPCPFVTKSIDLIVDKVEQTNIVVLDDYEIIGTVQLIYKRQKSACICLLFVREDHRREGIATLLINECCEKAKKEFCETLGLIVNKDNEPALNLYHNLGFKFAYEYEDNTYLMVKQLQ